MDTEPVFNSQTSFKTAIPVRLSVLSLLPYKNSLLTVRGHCFSARQPILCLDQKSKAAIENHLIDEMM